MMKHVHKKILPIILATTFVTSVSYGMDTLPSGGEVLSSSSYETMRTVNAKVEDFISILNTIKVQSFQSKAANETDAKRVKDISNIKEQIPSIKKNLELIRGTNEQKIEFLDWCYSRWAAGALEDANFQKYLTDFRTRINSGENLEAIELTNGKLKPSDPAKVKFPEAVSKWGDPERAAWLRLKLENLLLNPTTAESIAALIEHSFFVDYTNPVMESLGENPNHTPKLFFEDNKASEVAKRSPSMIHIFGDRDLPGGGVLKGTFLQEESTVTALPETLLAVLALSDFAYPLKPLQGVMVGNAAFVPMVDKRLEGDKLKDKDAPEMAVDYVNMVYDKIDVAVYSGILQAQRQGLKDWTLILGAAGCGAFANDPKLVSAVYEKVLEKYRGYIPNVGFVILFANANHQPFRDLVDSMNAKSVQVS